jgi:replicative DNA helicase
MLALVKLAVQDRVGYTSVKAAVDKRVIQKECRRILAAVDAFYAVSDEESVCVDDLKGTVDMRGVDAKLIGEILTQAKSKLNETIKAGILKNMVDMSLAQRLTQLMIKYEDGEELDILSEVGELVEQSKNKMAAEGLEYAQLDSLDEEVDDDTGMAWPMECLNRTCRKLRGGDSIIVAARPDTGKTTFIAMMTTAVLQTGKIVVVFNNEGKKSTILRRVVQSALRITSVEMTEKRLKGTLKEEWVRIAGEDRLRVYDVHNMNNMQLYAILKAQKGDVGMVVFDMLDNVLPTGGKSSERTDESLDRIYQWARGVGVEMDCVSLVASQLGADADGVAWPTLSNLAGSRTGKAGATDVVIMIGRMQEGMEEKRFLSTPKNKLRRPGSGLLKQEVILISERGYYHDGET